MRRQTWRLKKNHQERVLISIRSLLRHGKRRASQTNSRTKGLRLITYGQPLSGTRNKNKRPPRTRPYCSPGAIAAAASPLFRQPRHCLSGTGGNCHCAVVSGEEPNGYLLCNGVGATSRTPVPWRDVSVNRVPSLRSHTARLIFDTLGSPRGSVSA
jgi:hypothetical protein